MAHRTENAAIAKALFIISHGTPLAQGQFPVAPRSKLDGGVTDLQFWYTQKSAFSSPPCQAGQVKDVARVDSKAFGEWLSLVEHLVRDQGVGGSNPLSPTIFRIKQLQRFPPSYKGWPKGSFLASIFAHHIDTTDSHATRAGQGVRPVGYARPLSPFALPIDIGVDHFQLTWAYGIPRRGAYENAVRFNCECSGCV